MTDETRIEFEILVDQPDADNNDRDKLATQLIQYLGNDWDAKKTRGGAPEAGTKTGDAVTWGSVALAVLPTTVPSLIALIQAWISTGSNRTVKFKYEGIEYEGSRADLEKLLDKIEKGKGKKKNK